MCLLLLINSKTRQVKSAALQMEVDIAALYNTMHINQLTDLREHSEVEAMDLNMATDSSVQFFPR